MHLLASPIFFHKGSLTAIPTLFPHLTPCLVDRWWSRLTFIILTCGGKTSSANMECEVSLPCAFPHEDARSWDPRAPVAYQFQDSLDLGSLWRGLGGLLSISKPVRMTDGMESAWDWHKLTEDCIDGSSWNWCTGIEEKGDLLSVCACSLLLQCSFLSLGVICYLSVSYVFSFSHMRLYHICPVGFT